MLQLLRDCENLANAVEPLVRALTSQTGTVDGYALMDALNAASSALSACKVEDPNMKVELSKDFVEIALKREFEKAMSLKHVGRMIDLLRADTPQERATKRKAKAAADAAAEAATQVASASQVAATQAADGEPRPVGPPASLAPPSPPIGDDMDLDLEETLGVFALPTQDRAPTGPQLTQPTTTTRPPATTRPHRENCQWSSWSQASAIGLCQVPHPHCFRYRLPPLPAP